jgi:hypothetical protein
MKLDMTHENDERISEALRTPGGHLSIGRGGYTLYFNGSSRLQGYDYDRMREACIERGLPVIDSRTVPFDVVWDLAVKGPMVAVGRAADVAPWGAFSSAPLQVVADAYRAAGAEVFNLPEEHVREHDTSSLEGESVRRDQ